MEQGLTPLGALGRGLLAGIAGTAAMDLLWFARYKRSGGEDGLLDWEFSAGLKDWEAAPVSAQVGRRVVEGLFQRELPADTAPLVSNVTHWGYGAAWGAVFGVVAGSLRSPGLRAGAGPRGVGVGVRGAAPGQALQADVGVRRQDPGSGPLRPHGVRPDDRRHLPCPPPAVA